MKYANKIYTIVCDDVRDEKGNKLSLMGIYQRDIVLPQIPGMMKQLTIVLFLEDLKETFSEIHLTGKLPKSEDIKLSIKVPAGMKKGQGVSMVFGISPLKISAVGKAKLEFRFDKSKRPNYVREIEFKEADTK